MNSSAIRICVACWTILGVWSGTAMAAVSLEEIAGIRGKSVLREDTDLSAIDTFVEEQFAMMIPSVPRPLPPVPASQKQIEFLIELGENANSLSGISRDEASRLIDAHLTEKRSKIPPSARQIRFLEELGATEREIRQVRNAAQASDLIDYYLELQWDSSDA